MASYDLTNRIAPNLDRHLVFPLLEFLQERQFYPDDEILKAKIELLSQTNMVDYAMDIHKSLYHTEDVPQGSFPPYIFCFNYCWWNFYVFRFGEQLVSATADTLVSAIFNVRHWIGLSRWLDGGGDFVEVIKNCSHAI